jgi:hypothetical protein
MKENLMFRQRDDGLGCMRGIANGLILSVALWALAWGVWRLWGGE